MGYNDILIPVETSKRELDAKLLLGLFAADAGFRVHIGAMRLIRAPGFPPSIYISKSVRFAKPVELMSSLGHIVIAWDEEGLVRYEDNIHGQRIEPGALQIPRVLFSWGNSNSRVWKAHPFYRGQPIVETGNPRIDLLRPELRQFHLRNSAEIKASYGSFALLNTNFAMVNHFMPGGRRIKVTAKSENPEKFAQFRHKIEKHKKEMLDAFLTAVPVLARQLAPYKLVIRPHPSENPVPWIEVSRGLENVAVVYEGSVVPWLLATKCLIHNGCTSAVEASVLQTPTLAYCPVVDEASNRVLPNLLSEKFTDCHSLTARARELLSELSPTAPKIQTRRMLCDNIASLEGPLSCELIVAALVGLRDSDPPERSVRSTLAALGRYSWRAAKRNISPVRRNYEDHKSCLDDFDGQEIARRITAMREALQRFENIELCQDAPGIVTLLANSSETLHRPRRVSPPAAAYGASD